MHIIYACICTCARVHKHTQMCVHTLPPPPHSLSCTHTCTHARIHTQIHALLVMGWYKETMALSVPAGCARLIQGNGSAVGRSGTNFCHLLLWLWCGSTPPAEAPRPGVVVSQTQSLETSRIELLLIHSDSTVQKTNSDYRNRDELKIWNYTVAVMVMADKDLNPKKVVVLLVVMEVSIACSQLDWRCIKSQYKERILERVCKVNWLLYRIYMYADLYLLVCKAPSHGQGIVEKKNVMVFD